jgi:hypothetical protein
MPTVARSRAPRYAYEMIVRVEVSEAGRAPLPAIDVDEPVVIGSGASARVRLPAASGARAEHVRIAGGRWRDGDRDGELGDGATFEIGDYRVRVAPAPAGAVAAPPQRTESLARELLRGLLGDGGAPTLVVERGPIAGASRALAPPESTLVIGRGDEAGWVIDDGDLSRAHSEIRRGWDGTRVVDLGSKNGTTVDGARVGAGGAELHDGAVIALGNVALVFRDPAERHLRGDAAPRHRPAEPTSAGRASAWPFYVAVAICVAALAALAWIVTIY